MKRTLMIGLVILSACLSSCDDTYDFVKNISATPLYFNNDPKLNPLIDSLKNSVKVGSHSYNFVLNQADSVASLRNISFTIQGGSGALFDNKTPLIGSLGSLAQSGDPLALTFVLKQGVFGNYVLNFTAQNNVGNTSTASVNLVVFNNLLPVAEFSVTQSQVNGAYAYNLDASASYDKDARFGGLVKQYQYTITSPVYGTEVIFYDEAVTLLVLPGPGSYSVSLRVIDNDGGFSLPTTSAPIVIN